MLASPNWEGPIARPHTATLPQTHATHMFWEPSPTQVGQQGKKPPPPPSRGSTPYCRKRPAGVLFELVSSTSFPTSLPLRFIDAE